MAKEEEKITMEITKSEAIFILSERLESGLKLNIEPVAIFIPAAAISYLLYHFITPISNILVGLISPTIIIIIACLLLFGRIDKRRHKAEKLYEELKNGKAKGD